MLLSMSPSLNRSQFKFLKNLKKMLKLKNLLVNLLLRSKHLKKKLKLMSQ